MYGIPLFSQPLLVTEKALVYITILLGCMPLESWDIITERSHPGTTMLRFESRLCQSRAHLVGVGIKWVRWCEALRAAPDVLRFITEFSHNLFPSGIPREWGEFQKESVNFSSSSDSECDTVLGVGAFWKPRSPPRMALTLHLGPSPCCPCPTPVPSPDCHSGHQPLRCPLVLISHSSPGGIREVAERLSWQF